MDITEDFPLVSLSNVSFSYVPGSCLLQNVSFQLRAGEVTILAGENGCGKSTLLELMLGRLIPLSGNIRIFGKDPAQIHRMPKIGVISEPFHRVFGPIPIEMRGNDIQQWLEILDGICKKHFLEKMESLAISPRMLNRKIESFSKGERQRFLTGVILLRNPKLLLADEPLEGLDFQSRQKIGEQLRDFAKNGGAVFWVSHHLGETLRYSNHFFRIENGRLLELPQDQYWVTFPAEEDGNPPIPMTNLFQLPVFVEERIKKKKSITLMISKK